MSVKAFLKTATLKREEVDRFLDPDAPNWAQFDPELGYTLQTHFVQDGVDGAYTLGRYEASGERRVVNFADEPCRINSYGNSFTQCHQASDGETWQEHLAAHFAEPIRNFGVGGYGVYQAHRRMLRHEANAEQAAAFILFNIWGIDDHYRSIDKWRYLRCLPWFHDPKHKFLFHSNPWVHVRLDPNDASLVEMPNFCPTPESLYTLCDEDYVYEHFANDLSVQFYLGAQPNYDGETKPFAEAAELLGVAWPHGTSATPPPEDVARVYKAYVLKCSEHIVKRNAAFAKGQGKQLLLLLSYAAPDVAHMCATGQRPDDAFVAFLERESIPYVDSLAKHAEDFKQFNLTPAQYIDRYFIGHYNPVGNMFFAFAVKDAIVDWLDPKPKTYQAGDFSVRFDNYLPD